EDIWNDKDFWDKRRYHTDPIADLAAQGAEILINLSSSPFYRGKPELRLRMLQGISRKYRRPLVYVNLVGGNDSLVFDGMSLVLDGEGKRLAVARSFEEDLLLCDPLGGGCAEATAGGGLLDDIESVRRALVLGLRDYTRKCGFTQVVVGLSGGIDSALTCALAVEALGAQNVLGVLMPSPYSSPGSIEDAEALGRALGIETVTLPIGDLFATFREALSPLFGDLPEDVTEENLQARIRGTLLMAISNKFNRLLLTTGNKSELAVGYCTLYGDMCGGLAMISDVPKTLVYALARRINATRGFPVIPENTLTKPPSAELRPGQKDEDTLPPYEILDPILAAYIEEKRSIEEIVASGLERSLVEEITKRVDRNEYKRRQAPPGLKVTQKAFGMGRRYPIAQRYHPLLKREGKG
ncbi:MAG: NAD+ synthase, partial [Deltaproteobacteria bacterium]